MGIYACSSAGGADAVKTGDCARHGLRLLIVAFALYLLSGFVWTHMAQLYLLSGVVWAQMMQPSPAIVVQVLQALAALSAIASTMQTLLGAAPAASFPDLLKPKFGLRRTPNFLNRYSRDNPSYLTRGLKDTLLPPAKSQQDLLPPSRSLKGNSLPPAGLLMDMLSSPARSLQNISPPPIRLLKSILLLPARGLSNALIIPAGGLRNVLIILACGILIGSLSPRIGETIMFLYSLRAVFPSAGSHKASPSATGYDTNNSAEKETAEHYLLRDISN